MIICKRPAPHFDNYEKGKKNAFWRPSQWDKMCFECQRIKFQWKKWVNIFTHAYGQPDRKIFAFFTPSQSNLRQYRDSNGFTTILILQTYQMKI